jgi:hypothetical protein
VGVPARQERVDGYRDQSPARLFVGCGWTQTKIAAYMGQAQSWVAQRLLFGRFLRFITTGDNSFSPPKPLTERRFLQFFATACGKDPFLLPPNLTEGRFRKRWDGTTANGGASLAPWPPLAAFGVDWRRQSAGRHDGASKLGGPPP